jgi:multiple sugar transport system substrate-binding protein
MQLFSSSPRVQRLATGVTFVAVALMLLSAVSACGSSTPASTGPVTLTYWAWIPNMTKQVALFNASHPDIHVNVVDVGSGPVEYDKLYTAIKAKDTPDVAEVEYQLLPTFETTGGLLNIAPYGAASVLNDFAGWAGTQVKQGSAIYAIPQDSGPLAMFYRADIFTKYNLPVPTTWAQYLQDAVTLHKDNPSDYITDFNPQQPGQFAGYAWEAGAHWFSINGNSWDVTINDQPTLQVAAYWQNLISNKLVKTEPDFTNAWYNDLQTGTVATWITGAWGAGIIEGNAAKSTGDWKVALTPAWTAGAPADGDWGGSTTVVFNDTKHAAAAATFAEWISDNQGSAVQEFVGGGAYPALLSSLQSSTINSPQPFYGGQVINQVFSQGASNVDENFTWGPTMNQTFTDMGNDLASAVNGQGTLSDAINKVQASTVTYMKSQGFSVSNS